MPETITIRSSDGTEVLSLSNVRLDGHPFILLVDIHVRTYNCSWDEVLVFDRDSAQRVAALSGRLSRGEPGSEMLQLREDLDHLGFALDVEGRATVTGELSWLGAGWEGFGFDVDPRALLEFITALERAVETAK
jgi:hypothetical protein